MNQGHGILIFGFCFFLFLAWLWRYPGDEQLQSPWKAEDLGSRREETEVDRWLMEQGLEHLGQYMKTAGSST